MKNKLILSLLFLSVTSCINAMQGDSNDGILSLTSDSDSLHNYAPRIKPKKSSKGNISCADQEKLDDLLEEKQRQKDATQAKQAARALKFRGLQFN